MTESNHAIPTVWPTSRILGWGAALAIASVLLVTGMRLQETWIAATTLPGVAVTSGCEEESLSAIWRQTHQQPVYLEESGIPYASAYFNWLFYESYGDLASVVGTKDSGRDLVLVCRAFTFVGALVGGWITSIFVRRLQPDVWLPIFIGVYTFLGPLAGWWTLTARPDIWALTFEALGLVWFLTRWRRHESVTVLCTAVAFYLAWAFKPTAILGSGLVLLFLLMEKRWKSAALLVMLSLTGWALTFLLLGPHYRAWMVDSATANSYSLAQGLANAKIAFIKSTPLIILALGAMFGSHNSSLAHDTRRMILWGGPFALGLAFVGSCKYGAANNYYFTPLLLLALLAATAQFKGRIAFTAAAALGLTIMLNGYMLGHRTALQTNQTAERWALYANAPEPRFSEDLRLNLPWLNPHSPPLVLAFNYPVKRRAGFHYEQGGVGSLIEAGYFRSLLLFGPERDMFDHGSMGQYTPIQSGTGMVLYLRNDMLINSRNSPDTHP